MQIDEGSTHESFQPIQNAITHTYNEHMDMRKVPYASTKRILTHAMVCMQLESHML